MGAFTTEAVILPSTFTKKYLPKLICFATAKFTETPLSRYPRISKPGPSGYSIPRIELSGCNNTEPIPPRKITFFISRLWLKNRLLKPWEIPKRCTSGGLLIKYNLWCIASNSMLLLPNHS